MSTSLLQTLEEVLECPLVHQESLSVGFGLTGLKIRLADGRLAAVKAGTSSRTHAGSSQLELEGYMLRELRTHSPLPVPEVYYNAPDLLVMEWIPGNGSLSPPVQQHAAELLAQSHGNAFPRFGYERDTVIGPLHQPNGFQDKWVPFFKDKRLLYMARKATEEGRLPAKTLNRLEKLGEKLEDFLPEPAHPALLHGDLWSGNIIAERNRIAAFIDPAIYCGHPEIELAFTTMFSTFDAPFFDAYETLSPLEPGFHETRRELYNLYPTLVHVRLFGSSYLPPIHATLAKLGF